MTTTPEEDEFYADINQFVNAIIDIYQTDENDLSLDGVSWLEK